MTVAGLAHRWWLASALVTVRAVALAVLVLVAGWPDGAAAVSCDWIVAGGDGERCGGGAGGLGDECLVPWVSRSCLWHISESKQ